MVNFLFHFIVFFSSRISGSIKNNYFSLYSDFYLLMYCPAAFISSFAVHGFFESLSVFKIVIESLCLISLMFGFFSFC